MSNRMRYLVAFTAAIGMIMAILDVTIVNVALVPMSAAFKTDLSTIQWVVTGYFLAQAAVIPVAGYLSSRYGMKRLFILCLGIFTVGSVLCGLSQSESMLIGFRVLQGLGGGALFPLGQAIAFSAFPPHERAQASAIIAVPVLLAPVFGPTVGGLLTVNFGWEWIFFINLPVGLAAVTLGAIFLPVDHVSPRHVKTGFDYAGLLLSTLGVLAVVYAFTLVGQMRPGSVTATNPQGELHGWGDQTVLLLLAAGVALLVSFALYELRVAKDPVLDLRLFRERSFATANLVSWTNAVVVFGSLFLLPVFLQQVRLPNLSALDAGLALMPQGFASAFSVAIGTRLYTRLGVRPLVAMGGILLAISSYLLTGLTPTTDGWGMMPALIVRGLGFGLTLVPVQTMALEVISGPALAKASSLFNVTRQIFSSIGVAITITLFVQRTQQHATELIAAARKGLPAGVTPDLNNPLVQQAIRNIRAAAGTAGVNDVFRYVVFGCLVLSLVGLALPAQRALAERRRAARERHMDAEDAAATTLLVE